MVSLDALRRRLAEGAPAGRSDEDSVRRQWWAALATLQDDLLAPAAVGGGLWLAAPLPALYEPDLLRHLQGWVWAPASIDQLLPSAAPLLPGGRAGAAPAAQALAESFQRLPLREGDGTDPLLVLITRRLQVALALDGPAEGRRLLVRFDAPVLSTALALLDRRLQEDDPAGAGRLRQALKALGTLHNDPSLALQFWPLLAQRLAGMAPSVTLQPVVATRPRGRERRGANGTSEASGELALLEALTHEVRTPLATIRTLIRSLLRRSDLPPLVRQRLEQIDGECSEQIDRFGLIFLAAELQRRNGGRPPARGELARTDLAQLLRQLEALWRRQMERRGLTFRLAIEADLPPVLSDPTRLETMLGGLMDRFCRGLPSGSQVVLHLQPAGPRLKLRLSSEAAGTEAAGAKAAGEAAAGGRSEQVGPVLSWNPDTGSLQLSRQATRQLFHQLGGRLTERGGSSLTVFFPLAERSG
ncbi:MAG: histidine kinase dimerization/phospho-acceptor domain-containing protein [Synechococcaceae cyanobacterium]|nr:histidine kinase dimerization/phospho-acceptor domain-containing protein [Synechococcaceae cyanobacterium]